MREDKEKEVKARGQRQEEARKRVREEREELEEIRTQKDCVKAKGKEEDMNRTNEDNDVSWIRVDDGSSMRCCRIGSRWR